MQRAAAGQLRWALTQYPCPAYAQEADMSLREYEDFVYAATFADQPDPIKCWRDIHDSQQRLVDWLKGKRQVTVRGPHIDMALSIAGRTFINSDGKRNMPSGEIFTGPVEDSVEGWVRFTYPAIRLGVEVEGVELEFKAGKVVAARARKNEAFLLSQLDSDAGARYLGEFAIGPMVKPFWVDQGRSLLEIGLVPTALGIGLSIAGALAGGAFMQRHGTHTALWALGLPQAVSNLGYAAVALWGLPWPALYAASMLDSFSGGLGTAAFLAFFLAVCDPERATLQYAFLSSLFSFTGRLAGAVSGIGAEQWGYGPYFALTFLASLPGLCLVPLVASWLPGRSADTPRA